MLPPDGSDHMINYRLVPKATPDSVIEFSGTDAGTALIVAKERGLTEADLFEGEQYIATIERLGTASQCWTIRSRDYAPPGGERASQHSDVR